MATVIDNDAAVLGEHTAGYGQPHIIRCSSNLVFVGHVNESGELEIHRSTNGGSTFSLCKTFTLGTNYSFSLVPLSSTQAGVAFHYNGYIRFYRTDDSGDNWTEKWTYSKSSTENNILLSYSGISNYLYITFPGSIYRSTNKGDSFSNIAGPSVSPYMFDIDTDVSGNLYVLYNYNSTTVYFYKYPISGSSSNLLTISGNVHSCKVVVDASGNRYVFYVKTGTTDQLVVRRNEGSEVVLYDPNSTNIILRGNVSAARDNDNNIYVYYTKTSDGYTYFRKFDGDTLTWGPETLLINVSNTRINTEKRPVAGSDEINYIFYRNP